jgi:hypothetical protein
MNARPSATVIAAAMTSGIAKKNFHTITAFTRKPMHRDAMIVDAHGGTITGENLNGGATFTVRLPRSATLKPTASATNSG